MAASMLKQNKMQWHRDATFSILCCAYGFIENLTIKILRYRKATKLFSYTSHITHFTHFLHVDFFFYMWCMSLFFMWFFLWWIYFHVLIFHVITFFKWCHISLSSRAISVHNRLTCTFTCDYITHIVTWKHMIMCEIKVIFL